MCICDGRGGRMTHKVIRIENLMYKGCESHWKCVRCGVCIPLHCFDKEDLEKMECKGEMDEVGK